MRKGEHIMAYFQANMTFDSRAVVRLVKAQMDQFCFRIQAVLFSAAVISIYVGVFLSGRWMVAIPLIALGCGLIALLQYPIQHQVRIFEKSFSEREPKVEYTFLAECFNVQGVGSRFWRYDQVEDLLCDGKYLYLLTKEKTLLMIDKNSIPVERQKSFLGFLEEKTENKWRHRLWTPRWSRYARP